MSNSTHHTDLEVPAFLDRKKTVETKKAVDTFLKNGGVVTKIPEKKAATKKAATKKAAPAKKAAKKEAGTGSYDPAAKITVIQKENPRLEGSDVHKHYVIMMKSKTVGDYVKAGGRLGCLTHSIQKKWAKVSS